MSDTGAAHAPQPFFLPGAHGALFSLYFPAHVPHVSLVPPRGIVFFPPFAEEMNKARRMVALQARSFAQAGFAVLLVDLYGTGDSAGDFSDARWSIWREDMRRAAAWLQAQGCERLILWGLRSGALLAADLLPELGSAVERMLLWHPVARGEQLMTQFLRLQLAADLMIPGEKKTTQELRARLSKGETLEVAGYMLAPELVQSIDSLNLRALLLGSRSPIDWLEISAATDRPLAPVSRALVDELRQLQMSVRTSTIAGETFWNTLEISEVPQLIERSTAWLTEACP